MGGGQEEAMKIERNSELMGYKETLVFYQWWSKAGGNGKSWATYKGVKNIFSCPLKIK